MLRRLRVSWTVRRSNQSILKDINPENKLGRLMLKLQLQYFGLLMGRVNSLEKTLMVGKFEGSRRRGKKEDEVVGGHHWLSGHLANFGRWWRTEEPDVLQFTGLQRVRHNSNWTGTTIIQISSLSVSSPKLPVLELLYDLLLMGHSLHLIF